MSLVELTGLLGQAEKCSCRSTRCYCEWSGIKMLMIDADLDGRVALDEQVKIIWVKDGYTGRTADGLGIGSSLDCFVQRFPDSTRGVDLDVKDGWLYLESVQFREPRLIVKPDQEGRVISIQLASGPPTPR